jgi:hypothetical protein
MASAPPRAGPHDRREAAPVSPVASGVRRRGRLRSRSAAVALLGGAVLALHLWALNGLGLRAAQLGEGRAARGPQRLKVDFVAELHPRVPPPTVAAAPLPRRARITARVATPVAAPVPAPFVNESAEPAASAPEVAAAPPVAPVVSAASVASAAPIASVASVAPVEEAASEPAPVAQAAAPESPAVVAAPAPAASAPVFDWPRSTRLSYRLTGDYRGPIEGQASVEWLRDGAHYQVHLDVSVGLSFAPLMARRMSSDGEIGPGGLTPRRYDEETRFALREPRALAVRFDGGRVRLANGQVLTQPAGVQDTASQFVQLTWLFTTRPELLRPGQTVTVMLALPRRVDPWVYEVLDAETLYTPAGAIEAVRVKPRPLAQPAGELVAESWFAPTLQYLPVRIVIRQDGGAHIDLLLDRLPLQAADGAGPGAYSDSQPAPVNERVDKPVGEPHDARSPGAE